MTLRNALEGLATEAKQGLPAVQPPTTGAITANGQTIVADVSTTSNIVVYVTGTFATHTGTFEGSLDGTTWFGLQAVRSNANTIELTSGSLSAAPAYSWELSVNGLTNFRIRATTHGSGTANWRIQPAPFATEPIPAAQVSAVQPVNGTLTSAGTTVNTPATPTVYVLNSLATANLQFIKATAGTVYSVFASNANAAVRYLKLYNKATAPVVASDVPVMVIAIPPTSHVHLNLGALGHRFTTGIAHAIVTGIADTDGTAVAAAEVKLHIAYI